MKCTKCHDTGEVRSCSADDGTQCDCGADQYEYRAMSDWLKSGEEDFTKDGWEFHWGCLRRKKK